MKFLILLDKILDLKSREVVYMPEWQVVDMRLYLIEPIFVPFTFS